MKAPLSGGPPHMANFREYSARGLFHSSLWLMSHPHTMGGRVEFGCGSLKQITITCYIMKIPDHLGHDLSTRIKVKKRLHKGIKPGYSSFVNFTWWRWQCPCSLRIFQLFVRCFIATLPLSNGIAVNPIFSYDSENVSWHVVKCWHLPDSAAKPLKEKNKAL